MTHQSPVTNQHRPPRLTREQAAIVGAYTRIAAGPFSDIQAYAERKLGRPILTHEFGDKEVWREIQEAAKDDYETLFAELEGDAK